MGPLDYQLERVHELEEFRVGSPELVMQSSLTRQRALMLSL